MTTKTPEPVLPSALTSTGFWGKCVLQVLIIVNAIWPAVKVSPEVSLAVATLLELAFQGERHVRKMKTIETKARVAEAHSKTQTAEANAETAEALADAATTTTKKGKH